MIPRNLGVWNPLHDTRSPAFAAAHVQPRGAASGIILASEESRGAAAAACLTRPDILQPQQPRRIATHQLADIRLEIADIGLVGDLFKLLPELEAALG